MAENSENIEAKLCAYVEGDLDEAGRVEIEKHLEAHPNHRRLLAELTATRDLLRYLPREQAPPDLAEAFNAQLERSALLDAPAAEANNTDIRGNLLPRLLATAAIVLLTVGLGAVVYFALPHGESRTQLAMPDSATQPTEDRVVATTEQDVIDAARRAPGGVVAEKRGGPAAAAEGALATAETGRLGKAGVPATAGDADASLPEVVSNIGPNPAADAFARVHGKGGAAGAAAAATTPAGEPVYLIVTAADKAQAVQETTSLLADNRISWMPAEDESAPADQPPQQQAAPAEESEVYALREQQQQQRGATYAQIELSNAFAKRDQQKQLHAQTRQLQAEQAVQSEALSDRTAPADVVANAKDEAAPADSTTAAAERSLDAESTANAEAPAQQQQPVAAAPSQPQQQQQQQAAPLAQDLALRADVLAIKARMTRSQVMQLSRALNRDSQQVELIADHPRLQAGNALLRQQQLPQRAARGATQVAIAPGAAPPFDRAHVTQAPAPAAAPAATTRPNSPINLKAGAGPTTRPGGRETELATAEQAQRPAPPPVTRERQMQMRQGSGPGARPERILAGQKLSVTVDELAAPGVDRTAVAEVGPDGTVRLPQLPEPLRLEGLTRSQAEGAIADAYKRSAGFDQATVTVEPADDASLANAARPAAPQARAAQRIEPQAPAREEAKGDAFGMDAAQQQAPAAGPSTRPAAVATTAPIGGFGDEPVEVVILVQGTAPPAAATEPAESAPAQSQPAPVDEPAPSDEADVPPAAPETDVPAGDGDAPTDIGEPGAPINLPEELAQPSE